MVENIYFDTNIMIDICDRERAMHQASLAFVKEAIAKGAGLYINSDTLATLFYILRNRAKMDFAKTLEKIAFVNDVFDLVVIDKESIALVLEICSHESFKDYEDALQYVCAKKVSASLIVTNDKHFVSPDIEVRGSAV